MINLSLSYIIIIMRHKNRYLLTKLHWDARPGAPATSRPRKRARHAAAASSRSGARGGRGGGSAPAAAAAAASAEAPLRISRDSSAIYRAVRDSVRSCFGDFGSALVTKGLAVKYAHAGSSVAVVRCGRDDAAKVRAAMAFVTEIQGDAVVMEVFEACGSVRTCASTLLAHQAMCFERRRAAHRRPKGETPSARDVQALEEIDREEEDDAKVIRALDL